MTHRFTGAVAQLYVDEGHCYVTLQGLAKPPKDGLFDLELAHPNYNALYSLALAAAVNGYALTIRIHGEIEDVRPDNYPRVFYFTVGW